MQPDFFAGLKAPVNFFIVRHGQSEGNVAKILQGREEYPLSEEGRRQAAIRGQALKAVLSGKLPCFSSPQARAKETAQIISEQIFPNGVDDVTFLDELVEMSLGIWTGKVWEDVRTEDPDLWSAFMARSWDAVPKAESSRDMYDRSLRVWTALRDAAIESGADNVLVITHGGLIQWLFKTTFQCRLWFPLFPISNCGQSKLCVKPNMSEKNAYMCWEEIDAPLPNQNAQPLGFPC